MGATTRGPNVIIPVESDTPPVVKDEPSIAADSHVGMLGM
jgi:hypothetical protein